MQFRDPSKFKVQAQLDELTRAVEVEVRCHGERNVRLKGLGAPEAKVIHPLHARVKQLTVQVQERGNASRFARAGCFSRDNSALEIKLDISSVDSVFSFKDVFDRWPEVGTALTRHCVRRRRSFRAVQEKATGF